MEFCLIADSSAGGVLTLCWTILKVAGGLGFVIFVHELGHFLVAKACGVKCEKFYVGFDVPIRIGPLKLPAAIYKFQRGETEYGIGIIPLGGYVRLFGQNVTDEDPSDPANYASKSILQRIYILVGGPAMNLLFALVCMPLLYLIGIQSPAYLDEIPKLHELFENRQLLGRTLIKIGGDI